jgi:hypothetical protein
MAGAKNLEALGQLPPEVNLGDLKRAEDDENQNVAPPKRLERSLHRRHREQFQEWEGLGNPRHPELVRSLFFS